MSAKRILVLGGGFAGLWSAIGAARKLDEFDQCPDAVEGILVNRDALHSIRVRNYESDLTSLRVPLDDVLGPVGVRRVEGEVANIDLTGQTVTARKSLSPQRLYFRGPQKSIINCEFCGFAIEVGDHNWSQGSVFLDR